MDRRQLAISLNLMFCYIMQLILLALKTINEVTIETIFTTSPSKLIYLHIYSFSGFAQTS